MSEVTQHEIELRKKRAQVVMAYKRVFGLKEDGSPENADGALILEDLTQHFAWNQPAFECGPHGFDTHFAAIRDGQRRIKLRIDEALAKESEPDGNVKPKPEVQKGPTKS